jgi:hypothetical protein
MEFLGELLKQGGLAIAVVVLILVIWDQRKEIKELRIINDTTANKRVDDAKEVAALLVANGRELEETLGKLLNAIDVLTRIQARTQ